MGPVQRHDFALVFTEKTTKQQLDAISRDLNAEGFICTIRPLKEEGKNSIFISMENQQKIMAEAERQKLLKIKRNPDPR